MNSARVPNDLEAENSQRARLPVYVVISLTVTEAILVSGASFAMPRILGYAHSNEDEVISYFREMVPLVCVLRIIISVNMFLSSL